MLTTTTIVSSLIFTLIGVILSTIVSLWLVMTRDTKVIKFLTKHFSTCKKDPDIDLINLCGVWETQYTSKDEQQQQTVTTIIISLQQSKNQVYGIGQHLQHGIKYEITAKLSGKYLSGTYKHVKGDDINIGTFQLNIKDGNNFMEGKWIGYSNNSQEMLIKSGEWDWERKLDETI